ncbi:hypothetical protein SH203_02100 [Brevundimonas sp. SH203]|uniref:DUF2867 domain-containing protein n=1 Tax=Brevundimonas sp. SH203 TaxID=345167 RepID=UPI0009C6BD4C|nr:DUF2867 domain-containing protein [Brevundimonas sp. SH203]GAW41691.1 hypothetical protein SH203_02100 [Brevundimonas sp. SH203]
MAAAVELPIALPHPVLPGADWGDRYGVEGVAGPINARQAFENMVANAPRWIGQLMGLRNAVVRLVGLTSAEIGDFPVLSERADEMVIGFDDRHLDFRLMLRVDPQASGLNRVSIATLIERHNLLGRAYLAAITPFHKRIVARMLGGLAR